MTLKPLLLDLYLRLSDLRLEDMNERGESTGLTYHEKQLRDYAERIGATIGEVITENDIVDGKPKPASAWKRKTVTFADGTKVQKVVRPGFARILKRIETKQSDGFLAVDLDRALRDPRDLEDLIDTVKAAKANVRSLTGSLTFTDGGNSHEELSARIILSVAKKSSDDTSRRVSMARKRQAENGEWHGGKRPFGFESDGKTIRESEAQEIRDAAKKVLAGVSLRAITQDLRDRKVPTVLGGPWSPSSLKDILFRPRNAALMVYQGEVLPVTAPWPAIIKKDVWEAVVLKLTVRQASAGRAPRWLGSGIYYCTCGGKVGAHEQKSRPARYRCKDTGLMGGKHTSRLARSLDQYISDLVIEWAAQPVALRRLLPVDVSREIDVDALRAEAQSLKVRLDEKTRVNFETPDRFSDEQLFVFTELTSKRLHKIDELLAKALPQSPTLQLAQTAEGKKELGNRRAVVRAAWDSFSIGLRREIVRELLTVRLLPAPTGKHFDPKTVEIVWNL